MSTDTIKTLLSNFTFSSA